MERDRDTGPAAAQDRSLKKAAPAKLKFSGAAARKRPQNAPLAGRADKVLTLLKIIERIRLKF
jgi:hypothetical protein